MVAPLVEDAPENVEELGPSNRRNKRGSKALRLSAISVGLLVACAGVAFAAYRLVSKEIHRSQDHSEKRLNVHVYAPFGSLAVTPGTYSDIVAKLDMQADESGDDPEMYLRYGVTQSGVGNLRVSVGDDEGSLQTSPPLAMWKAASPSLFSTANFITSDNGAVYRYGFEPRDIAPTPAPQPANGDYKARLYLTRELPMSLNAQLGFGESYIDLTGLGLERAYIETGASKVHIVCSAQNKTPMSLYQISAGVGECTLDGICNTNSSKFEFNGGIGYYTLDFGGQLQHNMEATVSVGLGKVSLNIPPQAGRVQVFYDDNLFSAYNFSGLSIRKSGYATSAGFDQSTAPILTLRLSSGMGKMVVVYR